MKKKPLTEDVKAIVRNVYLILVTLLEALSAPDDSKDTHNCDLSLLFSLAIIIPTPEKISLHNK